MHPLEPTSGSRRPRADDDGLDCDCDCACAPQAAPTSPIPENAKHCEEQAQVPDVESAANSSSYSMCPDVALDARDILLHLHSVQTEEPQDTESDSDDTSFSLEQILRVEVQASRVLPLELESDTRRSTDMMKLQHLEDELVETLKRLIDLGVPRATLASHISPSIFERLFKYCPDEFDTKTASKYVS
ncbi:hypothetical protein B0H14DRAFT_2754741 [Mycena olivaceomarginata]|nr:hypothetical protein B0H14DRAFT_2754741 [Mycena olivaceomarginata]